MNKPELMSRFLKGNRLTYIGAMSAVLGNVAVAAIMPMVIKSTLDNILGNVPLATPFGTWLIGRAGGIETIRANLWIVLLVLIGLTLIQGVFQFFRARLSALTGENSAKRMRDRIFLHVLRQPFDYHVKAQTGDIIQRCTSDIETVQRFIANQSIEAGSIILQVIVVLAIMLSLDVRYTITSVFLIPIILVMTIRFFKTMMTIFLETDESEGVLSATLQENLTGVRVVKAFAAQQFEINKFDETNKTFRDNTMKIIKLMSNFWGATDFLSMFQFFFVVLAGTIWIAQGTLTIGTMVAFITYSGMLIWPIRNLGHMVGFMGQAFVSLTRIQEILDSKEEDYDTGSGDTAIQGGIRFEDVQFGYTAEKPLLKNLSFAVEPGTTTAILGATGSGKSSLVHLLLRLYDYQAGSIKIDGTELSTISRDWIRQHVGIVLQEPFLFSRTIEDNIRIGRPGSKIEDTRLAARIACVDEAIADFDEGYATMVGERGVTLSGGQRQRVAIARTILRDVPILIFDDSLSAVDTETDAAIRRALRERRMKTTTLIISHRITTLAEADQILVLDDGRIVQRGTHAELIRQEGHYKKIWELQSSMEDIA